MLDQVRTGPASSSQPARQALRYHFAGEERESPKKDLGTQRQAVMESAFAPGPESRAFTLLSLQAWPQRGRCKQFGSNNHGLLLPGPLSQLILTPRQGAR